MIKHLIFGFICAAFSSAFFVLGAIANYDPDFPNPAPCCTSPGCNLGNSQDELKGDRVRLK